MRATLQQYLHEFDAAAATLEPLLARPAERATPQAWLTLATVRRVQGRYADSDAACRRLGRSGAELHAAACLAENAALRGETARRGALARCSRRARHRRRTRGWLTTTLAELEQRDGRAAPAEAAFRAACAAAPTRYTRSRTPTS